MMERLDMQTQKENLLADKLEIDRVIGQFFEIFNNKNGKKTDWGLINSLCIPETIIIKKENLHQTVYHLASFIEPRKKILTDGTLVEFEEFETGEKTQIAAFIAQRYSKYQKSGIFNGEAYTGQGTKFFQLIKTESSWKICSVAWEDDAF